MQLKFVDVLVRQSAQANERESTVDGTGRTLVIPQCI